MMSEHEVHFVVPLEQSCSRGCSLWILQVIAVLVPLWFPCN